MRKEWRSRKKQQGDGESSQAGTGDERSVNGKCQFLKGHDY